MSDVGTLEANLGELVSQGLSALGPEDQDQLTRVLFPATDTKQVTIKDRVRELQPLTVKWTRKLHAILSPFSQAALEAESDDSRVFHADSMLADALINVGVTLAELYGWDDVKKACIEQDIFISELQELAAVQVQLNRSNDFLLAPLRLAVKIMQVRALIDLQSRKGSTSTTQDSSPDGIAASTS